MPRKQCAQALDAEKLAYWYFRLNGFLQIQNFVIHPGGKGSQRTDADLLAVRFPHRKEFLFDHAHPMQDDSIELDLTPDKVDVLIVEIKTNEPCRLNGPWTDPDRQNLHRVLAAVGCLQKNEIHAAAAAVYETGEFARSGLRIRLVAVGRNVDDGLARLRPRVKQLTWQNMIDFIWQRFDRYRKEKSDVQQWDDAGKQLRRMSTARRDIFLTDVLREIGVDGGEIGPRPYGRV